MSDLSTVSVMLSTELPIDKLNNILKQNCKTETKADLVAHDPTRLPALRIYELSFTSLEERDRLLIALRQRDQSNVSTGTSMAKTPRRAS